MPMILGTSVAGILRRAFEEYIGEDAANEIFGKKGKDSKNLVGSILIVSNALLVDENGMFCEELLSKKSKFLQLFNSLPIRDHVAINANGTAKDAGKFDEEVVFSGSRFKFSL